VVVEVPGAVVPVAEVPLAEAAYLPGEARIVRAAAPGGAVRDAAPGEAVRAAEH